MFSTLRTSSSLFARPSFSLVRRGVCTAPGAELLSPVWSHGTDIVVERAEGSYIYGTDGKKYLDFTCGIGVTNLGHCHPRIVKAIQEQAGKITHAQANIVYHKPMLTLAQKLKEIVKLSDTDRYFFANSGAEAIEASIKLARHATKKTNIITFEGSFHGRTIGTMSLTNSKNIYRVGYQPLMPSVFVANFPYTLHSPFKTEDEASEYALKQLQNLFKMQSAPEETAAILIEPILGEGGYVPSPLSFLKGLRKLCDEHNILLIFDEVQSGFGRAGNWFAFQDYQVIPDILVMAKGIANGLPLSGLIAREELHKKWKTGSHGGTYGGNALSCAAAVETINVFRDEKVLENVAARSAQLTAGLKKIDSKYPGVIAEVRGKGLMIGVEFSSKTKKGIASSVVAHAHDLGLLLLTAGAFESMRFIPALTVSEKEMEQGLALFEKALGFALAK